MQTFESVFKDIVQKSVNSDGDMYGGLPRLTEVWVSYFILRQRESGSKELLFFSEFFFLIFC